MVPLSIARGSDKALWGKYGMSLGNPSSLEDAGQARSWDDELDRGEEALTDKEGQGSSLMA